MSKSELEIDSKIENHKEACTKEFINASAFRWAIGIFATVLLAVFAWMFVDVRGASAKADSVSDANVLIQSELQKQISDMRTELSSRLSKIETDTAWIKQEMQK